MSFASHDIRSPARDFSTETGYTSKTRTGERLKQQTVGAAVTQSEIGGLAKFLVEPCIEMMSSITQNWRGDEVLAET